MNAKGLVYVFASATLSALASIALSLLPKFNNTHWFLSICWFSLFVLVCNYFYRARAGNAEFTKTLLAGIVIKLLLSFLIILVYFVTFRPLLFSFSMHFMLHYVIFTILEIRYLSQLIKSSYST